MILQMTLLLFMAAAAVKDYRSYWVPNELILAGALNGYILRFWADGSGGVIDGAAGMVLIFILCAGLFVLSMFGAGDLKLMMQWLSIWACKVCTDTDCVTGIWCGYFTVENVEI